MKTTTLLAVAFGVGALAACNKSPTEQAAQNVESNYENVAENVEAVTSNAGEAIESNAANASSERSATYCRTKSMSSVVMSEVLWTPNEFGYKVCRGSPSSAA